VSQAQAQTELTAISGDLDGISNTNKNRAMFAAPSFNRIAQNRRSGLIAMLSTLAWGSLRRVRELQAVDEPRAGPRREMALRLALARDAARAPAHHRKPSRRHGSGVAGLGVGYAGMTLFRQIELPSELRLCWRSR